ncbi:MAG TPA: sugar-binding protein, partial [Chloroflexota bacterium]|nr:sugar-binding protein [Chloroflexota bacterium]
DANLYFGTVALQSGADELPLSRLAQDSMEIFKDHDHLELMLDTNHDRNSFFQCCWNFKGSKWDFAYSAPRVAVDWSPAWEVTTEVQHNAFISELAIPLSALGGAKPKPGDTWGFTLARQQSAASGAVRYTIWSEYFRGDFLKPGLWSILKFE